LTKISYAVYNLDEHFNRDAFVSEFGEGSTFPQVIVDGKKIGGCIDTVKFLREKKIV
jgi:glutaredoxin